ncbi:hypothetical protein DFJ73DRAFT_960544 [Zopfochytrium polystomum]|nr:hypothetical protein DFJ73DRAFT_960544 [Zopfochytrium polystomum]
MKAAADPKSSIFFFFFFFSPAPPRLPENDDALCLDRSTPTGKNMFRVQEQIQNRDPEAFGNGERTFEERSSRCGPGLDAVGIFPALHSLSSRSIGSRLLQKPRIKLDRKRGCVLGSSSQDFVTCSRFEGRMAFLDPSFHPIFIFLLFPCLLRDEEEAVPNNSSPWSSKHCAQGEIILTESKAFSERDCP